MSVLSTIFVEDHNVRRVLDALIDGDESPSVQDIGDPFTRDAVSSLIDFKQGNADAVDLNVIPDSFTREICKSLLDSWR